MTEFETHCLVTNEDSVVRGIAARYLDLTPEEVELLSRDEDYYVRFYVAERDDLTEDQIERLSHDENEHVRRSIELNLQANPLLGEKKKNPPKSKGIRR